LNNYNTPKYYIRENKINVHELNIGIKMEISETGEIGYGSNTVASVTKFWQFPYITF